MADAVDGAVPESSERSTEAADPDLLEQILKAAASHPHRPALSGRHGGPVRYRELAIAVVATAKGLRRNGFESGQRLLMALRPDPAAVVLALGTVAAGGSVVFLDPGSGPGLFARRAAVAEPSWAAAESVFYTTGIARPVFALIRRHGADLPDLHRLGVRTLRSGPWLPGMPTGTMSLRQLAAGRRPSDDQPLPGLHDRPDAEAAVMFAGGTRAVVHTRGSLGAAMSMLGARCDIGHRARVYTDDLLLGLPALAAGAHWRLPPSAVDGRVDPVRFARNIGRATHIFLVPADLALVLTAISAGLAPRPTALQQVLLGRGAVHAPLVARTAEVLPNVRLLAVYGKPAMLPIAVAEGADKLMADPDGDAVGELLPGVRGRIAENGELMVRGPNLARGYLREPPMTELATGDLAVLRGTSVVLTMTQPELIGSGWAAIDPAPVEASVRALPGVGQAALIGLPGESGEFGEQRIVLALRPAGQRVNEHPLASEPKQSNSRDDDTPEAQQIAVLAHHPLATIVAAALPDLIGAATVPDQIVVLSALPTDGSGQKTDRAALGRLLSGVSPDEPESTLDRATGGPIRRAIAGVKRRYQRADEHARPGAH